MLMTGGFTRDVQQILQLLRRWQPERYLLTKADTTPSGLRVPMGDEAEAPWGAAAAELADQDDNGTQP
jgi:hypothetical protein